MTKQDWFAKATAAGAKAATALKIHRAEPTDLEVLVIEWTEAHPIEFEGHVWIAVLQDAYADALTTEGLKIDTRTIRRWMGKPPFVTTSTQLDGHKTLLVRLGVSDSSGPKTDRHVANILSKIWRETIGTSVKRREYGCLIGIAQELPKEHAPAIFKLVLKRWSEFMPGVKLEMAKLEAEGKGVMRYYEYPSIAVIRRFVKVAAEFYVMEKQATGIKMSEFSFSSE